MLLGINWHQHVCNDEVRRLTKHHHHHHHYELISMV